MGMKGGLFNPFFTGDYSWWGGSGSAVIPDDIIFVTMVMGQSNGVGKANAKRLAMTTYPRHPNNVHNYIKGDYNNTDNGAFQNIGLGFNTEELGATTEVFGAAGILAQKLQTLSGNPVYVINGCESGIGLGIDGATRDWDPTSTESFTRTLTYMYLPALADIQALHPDKTIKVIKIWHGGETDAQSDTKRDNFYTNFVAFDAAVSAVDASLATAPWMIHKLYFYQGDVANPTNAAREVVINAALQQFVDANPARSYMVDFSHLPKKVDLTATQKGGFTVIATDDNHNSYLQQIYCGETDYTNTLDYYGYSDQDTEEITTNTDFDPSTISASGLRLQMNRDNVTLETTPGGSFNAVTELLDSQNSFDFVDHPGTFDAAGITLGRLKIQDRKGCLHFPGGVRYLSNGAIGTSLFGSGIWSIGFKIRPTIDGPYTILLDQSAYAGDRSRLWLIVNADETFDAILQVGATIRRARTLNPLFSTVAAGAGLSDFVHVAVTCNGTNLRIYLDGALVTLSAVANMDGSLSGLTSSSYVNGTNPLVIGSTEASAGTFTQTFTGYLGELLIQPVAWSVSDIGNIMDN
jgi:hypothetical protein